MITIQQLHTYMELVDMRMAPVIPCTLNPEHMPPVAFEKDGQPALWCLECDTKLFIGERKATLIKKIIG
ncbi:MAG: hypothetical protein EB127_15060 [Alphaproteobacteria bacterium]|nr:hypothetical protein [Alphaproteobacteria bacterium]